MNRYTEWKYEITGEMNHLGSQDLNLRHACGREVCFGVPKRNLRCKQNCAQAQRVIEKGMPDAHLDAVKS